MRAARAAAAVSVLRLPRRHNFPQGEPCTAPKPHRTVPPKERRAEAGYWRAGAIFCAAFLFGDLGGVLAGRLRFVDAAQTLASYYGQGEHFSDWLSVFTDLYSGAFLQCTVLFLCGFSALAPWLIGVFLAGKGVVLGLCAAGVYSRGGAHGLVVYWLMTCLPELILLALLLWLALGAQALGMDLLHALGGQLPHARRASVPAVRRLILRYLAVLLLSAAGCLVGAGSAVLFAGVLL